MFKRGIVGAFARCRRANVGLIFAISLPVVGGAAAAAVDYNTWSSAKARLQKATDAAALAAAREFQLASATSSSVSRVAESLLRSSLTEQGPEPTTVTTDAQQGSRTVRMDATALVSPILSRILSSQVQYVKATATAKLSGTAPICVIGLDPKQDGTLHFESKSQITANRCAVYSNSLSPKGLQGEDNATLISALFCSAGGYSGKKANFTPAPVTDCPVMKDPLAGRAQPSVGPCLEFNKTISNLPIVLIPGTYCGGLKITNKATVTLLSGVYVIKDGPLIVDKKATLQGQNVGLFFSGDKASMLFDKDSVISLTAPKDGVMAGILMSEERQVSNPDPAPIPILDPILGILGAPPPPLPSGAPPMRQYRIVSDDARTLLGTIYFPAGRLMIDSSKPVSDRSAYTVIVVRRLDLFDGPNLYLNSDYGSTDIPVPDGVGPVNGTVSLAK